MRYRRFVASVVLVALVAGSCDVDDTQQCGTPGCNRTSEQGIEIMQLFLDEGDLASADLILRDQWPVPRFEPVQLPPPSQLTFTENPYKEKYWRFLFYSFRAAVPLLWAFRTTGKKVYRDKLLEVVQNFAERGQDLPFSRDKHTTAYRGMMLVNIYGKLDRDYALLDSEKAVLRDLIEETGHFLADPKHFDTDYNHGVNEASSLLLIAENFPDLAAAPEWGRLARERLDSLMKSAVGTDGVANELSPYYHYYILAALWQVLGWAKTNHVAISDTLEPTVQGMLRYGRLIMQPDGYLPLLAATLSRKVPSYEPEVMTELRAYDPQFQYIVSFAKGGQEPDERFVLFPSSQIAVMRSGFGPRRDFKMQTHVVFDMTPYRTVQSQFDALNVDLYSAGRRLLTDSGLYTYDESALRAYFVSTRAHNTVVVDGADQSPGTPRVGLTEVHDPWIYQSGSHDFYPGVVHRRGVLLLERDLVVVLDHLESAVPHDYTQTWHLQPDLESTPADGGSPFDIDAKDAVGTALAIRQGMIAGLVLDQVRGAQAPMDGWYSEEYEVKMPNWAIHFTKHATSADFVTLFASGPYADAKPILAASGSGGSFSFTVCAKELSKRVTVNALAGPGESVTVEPAEPCTP